MSDVSLSLGGLWQQREAEAERQAAAFAQLQNELEGLRAAYAADVARVARQQEDIARLQAELKQAHKERDEWQEAYDGEVFQRTEREHLVDRMMKQLKQLEDRTREEEARAAAEMKKAMDIQEENQDLKELVKTKDKELDETHAKLERTRQELAAMKEENSKLQTTLRTISAARSSKEKQVVALVSEKHRLLRQLGEARAVQGRLGGGGGGGGGGHHARAQSSMAALQRALPTTASALLARPSSATRRTQPEHERSASTMSMGGAVRAINEELRDGEDGKTESSNGSGVKPTPIRLLSGSALLAASSSDEEEAEAERGAEEKSPQSGSVVPLSPTAESIITKQDAAIAKQRLVVRLQKQIDLLHEKNAELEKSVSLLAAENRDLLIRFRAAHGHQRRASTARSARQPSVDISDSQPHKATTQSQSQSQSTKHDRRASRGSVGLSRKTTNTTPHPADADGYVEILTASSYEQHLNPTPSPTHSRARSTSRSRASSTSSTAVRRWQ